MSTTTPVTDANGVTHRSTYFTTGRPKTHWRVCSCGQYRGSGYSSARVARERFDAHVVEAMNLSLGLAPCGCMPEGDDGHVATHSSTCVEYQP